LSIKIAKKNNQLTFFRYTLLIDDVFDK